MRILLINDHWLPFVAAGAEVSVAHLAEALARAGHETHVLTRYPGSAAPPPHRGAFHLHTIPYGRPRSALAELREELVRSPRALRAALRDLERDTGPFDVVHANNGVSALALMPRVKRATSALRVVTVRSHVHVCPMGNGLCFEADGARTCATTFECARKRHPGGIADVGRACFAAATYGPYHPALRRAVEDADLVLADSAFVARSLAASGVRKDAQVVYEAVAVSASEPAAEERPQKPERRILFVGRLTREKGPDVLLRAFASIAAELPSTVLTFVGSGPLRAELESQAAALGLPVELLGQLDGGAVRDLYARSTVLVVPSVWPEPFGMVASEAVLCGLPVLVADVGGLAEAAAVPEGASNTFRAGDAEHLAEALRATLTSPPRVDAARREMVAARVAPDAVAARHLELYADALRARRGKVSPRPR